MPLGLENIASQRIEEMDNTIKEAKNASSEQMALSLLLNALADIREEMSGMVVDKVTVTNQDEVKAALRNELNRVGKPILAAIEKLNINKDQIERIKLEAEAKNSSALDDNFKINVTPIPKGRFSVDNLSEILIPDNLKINNFSDFQQYFNELAGVIRETFNVDIPAPQVTVNPPEISIPEQSISIPPINLDPLLAALGSLKFLSDRPNKPLAVRLSDGQKFIQTISTIVENQERQTTAFSQGLNESGATKAFKKVSQGNIGGNGSLELTDATTAVVISATSRTCKWVDICSNGGTAQIGDASAVQTVGAEVGVTLFVGQPYRVNTDNLNKVFAAGATNTRISWTYYV